MNIFIKVVDGRYISGYNLGLLSQDYPELPFDFLREDNPNLNQYGIYICNQLDKPPFVQNEFNCTLKDPELIDGLWIQDWQIFPKSPEEKRDLVPVVSMNQAKKALLRENKLEVVDQAISAAGGEAALDWQYASEVRRTSSLVIAFTSQLGWTEEEVNLLFQLAITL